MTSEEIFETTYPEELYLIKPKPLVVLTVKWNELSDKEHELLGKIIAAIKIPLSALNILTQPLLNLNELRGRTNRVIYFGPVTPGVSYYEALESGDIKFVCSEPLAVLLNNETARKQLWSALRQVFFV